MKNILVESTIILPANIMCSIRNKIIRIKGAKGSITKSFFKTNLIFLLKNKVSKKLIIKRYCSNKKHATIVRTVASIINNMIIGVTKGFEFRIRLVYQHFPINVKFYQSIRALEIYNYFGQKKVYFFYLPSDISVHILDPSKKEFRIQGNNLEKLGLFSGIIQNACKINNKDTRKFVDGVYVSKKFILSN
mmetsp:Transcript_31511/g.55445  ORF Transcript_31511/g.55445 Transcript_31511/m.55445 type:complete len:190 (+) Transcript_31511:124-693(+)